MDKFTARVLPPVLDVDLDYRLCPAISFSPPVKAAASATLRTVVVAVSIFLKGFQYRLFH